MNGWNKTKFADLLVESRDGEWGKGDITLGHQLSEVIRGTDFATLNSSNKELPKRWIKEHLVNRKKLQIGDILLETAGGTAKQSTGRSAILRASFFDQHKNNPVLCSSFTRYLRLDCKNYAPEFIYYLLQVLYVLGFMGVYNLQHTGVSRFQYTSFKKNTVLSIPLLKTQRKIAAVLCTYDDLIGNNKHRIALLENMVEEIYREWFVRFRFPGYQETKFKKGIPEAWCVKAISELCSEIRHSVKKENLEDDELYLGLEHFSRKSISIKQFDTADSINSNKLRFQERDILFAKIRPYLHKIAIAHFSGACSSDTIVIRPKNKIYEAFLLFTIFSDTFIELATISSKGTKMPRADWDFLSRLEIIVPSNNMLEKYQKIFDVVFDQIVNLLKSNELLTQAKKQLLLRLISGKLSVEDLDIQFPPSML